MAVKITVKVSIAAKQSSGRRKHPSPPAVVKVKQNADELSSGTYHFDPIEFRSL